MARAFALFTGSSVIGTLTQVAKGKITAVFLGAAGVGILNQLTSVWSLFSVVAGMGFYSGMVRHFAANWATKNENGFRAHMSSSAMVLILSSLLITLAGCLYSNEISAFVFQDNGARAELVCLILLGVPIFSAGQLYRAMLNGTRSVSFLVRARIGADIFSVALLAILIYPLGLRGAILGFVGLHCAFMIFCMYYVKRALGSKFIKPSRSECSWNEVKKNLGFGLNGLITVTAGIVATILVSRWIIGSVGAAENGFYVMALKVATIFLGGLSAAATGHYYPTLVASKTEAEMQNHINETLSLYFYLIPPIVVFLMTTGEVLMNVLFTPEFAPAAILLLLILPGDLFRVAAETMGVPLLVRKKLSVSVVLYLVWVGVFLSLAASLLPNYGITGVAIAYAISQASHAILVFITLRIGLGYQMSGSCARSLAYAFAMVIAASLFMWTVSDRPLQFLFSAVLSLVWLAFSYREPAFAGLLKRVASKVRL